MLIQVVKYLVEVVFNVSKNVNIYAMVNVSNFNLDFVE